MQLLPLLRKFLSIKVLALNVHQKRVNVFVCVEALLHIYIITTCVRDRQRERETKSAENEFACSPLLPIVSVCNCNVYTNQKWRERGCCWRNVNFCVWFKYFAFKLTTPNALTLVFFLCTTAMFENTNPKREKKIAKNNQKLQVKFTFWNVEQNTFCIA